MIKLEGRYYHIELDLNEVTILNNLLINQRGIPNTHLQERQLIVKLTEFTDKELAKAE